MKLSEYIEREQALLRAATPGPWEYGERQRIALVMPQLYGPGRCAYCTLFGEPVNDTVTTVRGQQHVHLVPESMRLPGDILAFRPTGSLHVVTETEEYGRMRPDDGEFIANVRTSHERAVDALAVLAEHDLPEHIINAVEAALEETP